jgi:hypothetical protein
LRYSVLSISFAVVVTAMPASATYLVSTEELRRLCTSESDMPSCLTYIAGVADQFAFQNYVALTLKKSGLPGQECVYARTPDDADAKALREIVLKYLNKEPQMLKNPAVVAVGAALTDAYPCPKLPQ